MKIEVGESLILTWLKHVKNCQLVQLNWKPSTMAWEYYNEDVIESIVEKTQAYFLDEYDLFKKNVSTNQIIQQGEIDALGVQLNGMNVEEIYAVDVAFHEHGLNYGSKNETVARVLKKLTRMAITILGFFNTHQANIIFASPKINNSVLVLLEEQVPKLQNLFLEEYGLEYKFELICNESFENRMINTIDAITSNVADTSELFMRSIQMYKLFGKKRKIIKKRKSKERESKERESMSLDKLPAFPDDLFKNNDFRDIKIGALVRSTLPELLTSKKVDASEIELLQDKEYSKETFDVNYPVLRLADKTMSLKENRIYGDRTRYYAFYVKVGDKEYLITSEWFERNKPRYILWLSRWQNNDHK